ncbi:hypothetical protein [Variovorax sp. J22G73]|uniref:hypothetical protein n=1 Tax=Variovorax sp. J22G73 TaxID=3053507 RepID=UPI0033657484
MALNRSQPIFKFFRQHAQLPNVGMKALHTFRLALESGANILGQVLVERRAVSCNCRLFTTLTSLKDR